MEEDLEKSRLKVRVGKFLKTDDDDESSSQLFKEWSFTDNAKTTKHLPRMVITSNVHCSKSSSKRSKDNGEIDGISPVLHALQELGAIHRQELVR